VLRKVRAAIALKPPGIEADYLVMDLPFSRLTILLGPNASGKTMALQTIAYLLSGALPPRQAAQAVAQARTLRPKSEIPKYIVGRIDLKGTRIYSIMASPIGLLPSLAEESVSNIVKKTRITSNIMKKILRDLTRDVRKFNEALIQVRSSVDTEKSSDGFKELYKAIDRLVEDIVGRDAEIVSVSPEAAIEHERDYLYNLIPALVNIVGMYSSIIGIIKGSTYHGLWLNYAAVSTRNGIDKSVIFAHAGMGVTVFKQRKRNTTSTISGVTVFHPGFIYWRGFFENLYKVRVKVGLVREGEAIRLLSEYIPWVSGYELIGDELHLKTRSGKRVSVYSLSDGQRVATFMSLLYALSEENTLFLIDTPEAFVHPDGLRLVADFITSIVAEGNQALVATQSIEFVSELLQSAKESGALDNTLVLRMSMNERGSIKAIGKWSGDVSLNSIQELGLDLRK